MKRSFAFVWQCAALWGMLLLADPAMAQRRGGGPPGPLQQAARLDHEGRGSEARAILQAFIDTVSDPAQKAQAYRRMAMSYAFEGDCANTIKYEQMVIDYWRTREEAEPQNAFFQQGEMANEGARVCIDAGDLETAEQWYRKGYELGLKEPEPRTHPKSLWEFRLAHALARIAARRGDKATAEQYVREARRILDSDPAMAEQQERFYPYLVGYVALYTGDLDTAEEQLRKAIAMPGSQNDPFFHWLLATTLEKKGQKDEAEQLYRKAWDLATANNPPAAFVKRTLRSKFGTP